MKPLNSYPNVFVDPYWGSWAVGEKKSPERVSIHMGEEPHQIDSNKYTQVANLKLEWFYVEQGGVTNQVILTVTYHLLKPDTPTPNPRYLRKPWVKDIEYFDIYVEKDEFQRLLVLLVKDRPNFALSRPDPTREIVKGKPMVSCSRSFFWSNTGINLVIKIKDLKLKTNTSFAFSAFSLNELAKLKTISREKWAIQQGYNKELFKKIQDIDPNQVDYKRIPFISEDVKFLETLMKKNGLDPEAAKLTTEYITDTYEQLAFIETSSRSPDNNTINTQVFHFLNLRSGQTVPPLYRPNRHPQWKYFPCLLTKRRITNSYSSNI